MVEEQKKAAVEKCQSEANIFLNEVLSALKRYTFVVLDPYEKRLDNLGREVDVLMATEKMRDNKVEEAWKIVQQVNEQLEQAGLELAKREIYVHEMEKIIEKKFEKEYEKMKVLTELKDIRQKFGKQA